LVKKPRRLKSLLDGLDAQLNQMVQMWFKLNWPTPPRVRLSMKMKFRKAEKG
tara:strand:+ start:306 stop:461 length:156 start_codon:yes stop_codon:yes gene_type:complete